MRVSWKELGVLDPVYRLVGEGLSDADVARKLSLPEPMVHDCIRRVLRCLEFADRSTLAEYYSNAAPTQLLFKGALLERLDYFEN